MATLFWKTNYYKFLMHNILGYCMSYILAVSEIRDHIDLSPHANCLNEKNKELIHTLCWETMFGQELVKLTIMDLVCNHIFI